VGVAWAGGRFRLGGFDVKLGAGGRDGTMKLGLGKIPRAITLSWSITSFGNGPVEEVELTGR
jgi:hypothetical protein